MEVKKIKFSLVKFFVLLILFFSFYFVILYKNKDIKADVANTPGQYFKGNGGYGKIINSNFHDLDYAKDFSAEAVVDVKSTEDPYQWLGIISKTSNGGMYNLNAGWVLGLRKEGVAGAQIYIKVGDGTVHAQTHTEKYYFGRLHLAMVWNSTSKTVTLFLNGEQVAQQANAGIVLSNIKNSYDFLLGQSSANLKSPIIYTRLWNKDISQDVPTLYTYYHDTKQHELPEAFDRSGLISEWLMFEECDASGGAGASHIKDTAGMNHIQMFSGADIISGAGNFSLSVPGNEAVNVNKSVTLTASGGYDALSAQGIVKGPLQYYFQIDENSNFNSSSLKESGWVAEYPAWQPVLGPGKTYYWRAKVKDSSGSLESSYSDIYSFVTEGIASWYVRPEGGNYGAENGTSYSNAWDGLGKVVWGENGVEVGDTLYVCGTHVRNVTSGSYIAGQGSILPEASGLPGYEVVISGNCPDDPGVVWGAWKDSRPGGMVPANWQEVSPGVFHNISAADYNKSYDDAGLFENVNGTNYDRYTKITSSQDVINSSQSGVYYMQAVPSNRNEIWLRPFNSATFRENIRWSGTAGWKFLLPMDHSYLKLSDMTIIAGGIGHQLARDYAGPYHDIIFSNMKFLWGGEYDPINSYNITVDGCEFAYASNGIYVVWNNGSIHHLTIKNSYFHDIGRTFGDPGTDGHGIGVQNNEYIYVQNNRFERCGSAVCFHVGAAKTMKHFYVENNFISDMREGYGTDNGGGIVISGDNDNPKGNCGDMVIKNNVISHCHAVGIATNRKDYVEMYNNTINDCAPSLTVVGNREEGADAKVYNNVSLNPGAYQGAGNPIYNGSNYHFYFNQNHAGIAYNFEADNNLYYPNADNANSFFFLAPVKTDGFASFTKWKTYNANAGDSIDGNSLLVSPSFSNATKNYSQASDFNLQWNSPSIDTGAVVSGRTADYYGHALYGAPDIGAIEYQPPYAMGTDKPDISANIRIYGDGKFRNKNNPSGTTANLSVIPASGDTAKWLDLVITTWNTSGDYKKKWTEESPNIGSGPTSHTVGDLKPNTNYDIKVNAVKGQGISGCASGTCISDAQGKITFNYTGGYSENTFEITEGQAPNPSNAAPQVSAGTNQTITLPANSVNLSGTATDDGLPNPPGALTKTWSKVSGPGNVTFGNASSLSTSAAFSQAGTYVLRLTANDSVLTSYDEITITVNPASGNGGGGTGGNGNPGNTSENDSCQNLKFSSIVPLSGKYNDSILLNGKGFGTAKGKVFFGNREAEIISWQDTKVNVKVPSGITGKVNVNLKAENCASSNLGFTILENPSPSEKNGHVKECKMTLKNLYGIDKDMAECISLAEARMVFSYNKFVNLDNTGKGLYMKIMVLARRKLDNNAKYAVAEFINEGTASTERLGAGERAGVIGSYFAAFGKLPQKDTEWQDMVKIANGRWPMEKNDIKEKNAEIIFKKIYARAPNMANANDNAAVTIITYGLRPAARNTESERAGIKIFKGIFGYNPASAEDWDVVRAIAYSGAKR